MRVFPLKILAVTAVLLLLWGCTGPATNGRKASTSAIPDVSAHGEHVSREEGERVAEVQELRKALEARMEGRWNAEELPTGDLIELARLHFLLGERVNKDEKKALYEKGRQYAALVIQKEPSRVEGHYWLALNSCGVAENSRPSTALGMLPEIVDTLKIAVKLDETYDRAGPHRVIGRLYSQAPGWPVSVGDPGKAIQHLRRAVQIAPENSTNRLYLAESLIQEGMIDEAGMELEKILASSRQSPQNGDVERDRRQAIRLMTDIRGHQ